MTNNIWQFPLPHGLKAKNASAKGGDSSSPWQSKRRGKGERKRGLKCERVEGTTRVHAIAQSLDSETFLEYLIRKLKIVEMPATLIISSHYPLPCPLYPSLLSSLYPPLFSTPLIPLSLLFAACQLLLASCRRLLAVRIQSLGRLSMYFTVCVSVCFSVCICVCVCELFGSVCVACHRPNNFCQCIF